MQLLMLFALMLAIGALSYGGGYAIIGVLQHYLVNQLHWLSANEFANGLVIGQITPGPLSTMVAYVGYKLHGWIGGIVATLGLLLPSFLASLAIAKAYQRVKQSSWVRPAIRGISLAVTALLAAALVTLTREAIIDGWTALIAFATFAATGLFMIDPLLPFIMAAIAGIMLYT